MPQLQLCPGRMPEAEAGPEHTRIVLQETMTISNESQASGELESLKAQQNQTRHIAGPVHAGLNIRRRANCHGVRYADHLG